MESAYFVTKPVTLIGRATDADLQIADGMVSRRHAEVRYNRETDDLVLVDLGSTNGTLVNNLPIGEHALSNADRISLGDTTLVFERDPVD